MHIGINNVLNMKTILHSGVFSLCNSASICRRMLHLHWVLHNFAVLSCILIENPYACLF
jgi:hypothetical protein